MVKNPPTNAGDARNRGSIPGLGRPPGGGCGNPLQYSGLENSMDRGAWWATAHRVTESDKTEVTWHAHLACTSSFSYVAVSDSNSILSHRYSHPCFLLVNICMEYLFLFLNFQTLSVLKAIACLLYRAYIGSLLYSFQSLSVFWLMSSVRLNLKQLWIDYLRYSYS